MDESGAIRGIVNILLKQKVPKIQKFFIHNDLENIKIKFHPGLNSIGIYDYKYEPYYIMRYMFITLADPR